MEMDDPAKRMAAILTGTTVGKKATESVKSGKGEKGGGKNPFGGFFAKKTKAAKRGVTKSRILEELGEELNDLWALSAPHKTNLPVNAFVLPGGNPTTAKNEQGCWIIYNTNTDTLRSARFVMSNSRDSCAPGAPPLGANEQVGAFFHTHPNTNDEGYDSGPSPADVNFATSNNYPGLIRTQVGGIAWYGPNLPD